MYNTTKIIHILLLILLPKTYGFAPGTLVKTPLGYARIENIRIGDIVIAYDAAQKTVVLKPVIEKICYQSSHYNYLWLPNYIVIALNSQLFFNRDKGWIPLSAYALHDTIATLFTDIKGSVITPTALSFSFYILRTADLKTYCITPYDIIVQSTPPPSL